MTGGTPSMRPVSQARISVISSEERDPAFPAMMARAAGEPLLVPVSAASPDAGCGGFFDLSIGLHARIGLSRHERLVGSIAVRERVYPLPETGVATGKRERLVVMEAPVLNTEMRVWRPPLGVLLAATATVLIAIMAHDDRLRTYVACRAPGGDPVAVGALDEIGARPMEQSESGGPSVAGKNVHALRFLDAAAAARSAGIVLDHLQTTDPTWLMAFGGSERRCEAVLDIAYPRALTSVREELIELQAGKVDLDWRVPVVVGNDVALPGRRQANVARV